MLLRDVLDASQLRIRPLHVEDDTLDRTVNWTFTTDLADPSRYLIKGQLVSIDEGNRTERVIIGLGAGRSDVQAHAQVYEVTPSGRQLIDTIEVDAKSGLAPGMAETMGAGGLTGHLLVSTVVGGGLHVADEAIGANVVADADRAAKGIAKQLSSLFTQQGWIAR